MYTACTLIQFIFGIILHFLVELTVYMYSFIFVKISVPAGARLNVSLPAGQAKRRKLFKLFIRLDLDFNEKGAGIILVIVFDFNIYN